MPHHGLLMLPASPIDAEPMELMRRRIQVANILDAHNSVLSRLAQAAMGLDDPRLTRRELAACEAYCKAAVRILAKVLPDLKSIEVTGENGGPIKIQKVERVIISAAYSDGECI